MNNGADNGIDKEARRNAFLYCKFRDEQFALYDEYVKRHGILMKTLLVANVLYYARDYEKNGGLTQAEICQRTLQSKQTVNLIIKNMLAEQFIEIKDIPDNKRNKLVVMTDAGRQHYGEVVRHITWAEDRAMSLFFPEEQQQLIALSRTFTQRLTELINQDLTPDLPNEAEDGSAES